jgi:hypothetical protein
MNRAQRRRDEKAQAERLKRIARFNKERDAVARGLDVGELIRFCHRWKIKMPAFVHNSTIPMAIMHKARLSIRAFSPEEKMASAKWLTENNHELPDDMELVDGVLLGAEYNQ